MRVALDTNILVYVEGVNGPEPKEAAAGLIRKLPASDTFVPIQVLGELFLVLLRKAGWSRAQARMAVLSWHDTFPVIETSSTILLAALELCVDHKLRIWDAVILAGAAEAECRLLLSEDLQDGFAWRGVTVVNPFARKKNDVLKSLLDE